ncbi:MAG TPA: hypothetical protein PL064_14300, partial [Thermogutta sp.]|nr:hypothetical protein [Thermogutta sp.]
VLATVTNYRRDPESDARFIRLLQEAYEAVYLWPQGLGDGDYVRALGFRLNELGAGLGALDEFLREVHCDYVGTRLHGGIYCLNQGKRSLVLSVDNRAAEMCPEVGIPSVDRCDVGGIRQWVEDPVATTLTLNREAIDLWRGQFSE